MNALIGYTGFVGTTLLRQQAFDSLYRSSNISEIAGQEFDLVVCAGAPAQKWIANRDPALDRKNMEQLITHLKTVHCTNLVLISTVDVFQNPVGVNEATDVEESGLNPYGLHRRMLEKFVQDNFPGHLIVRLPGLVGPSLRKNVIFDLLNDNNVDAIDSRGVFQFYPMINLWHDIQVAVQAALQLVHLTAEPVSVAELCSEGFGRRFEQVLSKPLAHYNMQSLHADIFGGGAGYQYSRRETMQAIRAYAQSEPVISVEQTRSSK